MLRRATFSVCTVMTASRLLRIAPMVKATSARPITEKTMVFLRFLDFAISDLPLLRHVCGEFVSPGGKGYAHLGYWLSGMDSNHDKSLQRALCYHYTTGQPA